MYLKALELSGFKSFYNKTILQFNQGITSVVGPNGSGKSNILDAILWVLGEQSYKNIRAKESADIIFSSGKKSANYAEVSLIIDNTDGYLELEDKEIKITRILYPTGDGEYKINNKRVRLKDIHNLFMDTGIGKQAYSVIGQGRVERIIGSSPRELREIIEEAAGIKRAKIEKEQATKKLDNVRIELDKIEYIENELTNKVEKLREESNKAKIYKVYQDKINLYRYMVNEFKLIDSKNELKISNEDKEELDNKLQEITEALSIKNEELLDINTKRKEGYDNLESKKIEFNNNLNKKDRLKDELSDIINKKTMFEVELSEKIKRQESINKSILDKKEILDNSEKQLLLLEDEILHKKNDKEELEIKLNNILDSKTNILNELKKSEQLYKNYEILKIKINGENEDILKRINLAKNKIIDILKEKEEIEKEYFSLLKEKEYFEEKNINNEDEKKKYILLLEKENYKKHEINNKYNIKKKEMQDISYNIENINTKISIHENIIKNNTTMSNAVKYILNNRKDEENVLGVLINLIDIPEEYQTAITALISGNFQDIVTKNVEVAKKCIQLLEKNKVGRSSFLPLDTIKVLKLLDKTPAYTGVIGFARDLVNYKNTQISKVVNFVLSNTLIVDNLENAVLVSKSGYIDRIVTLDGNIISSRGRITGGHNFKKKDELLIKKNELSNYKKEYLVLNEKYKNIEKEIQKINEEKLEIENNIFNINEKYNKFKTEYSIFDEKYEEYNNKLSKYTKQLNTILFEEKDNQDFITTREEKLLSNKKQYDDINEKILENNEYILELNKKISEIEDDTQINNLLNTINIELVKIEEKLIYNKDRYNDIKCEYDELNKENNEIKLFIDNKDNIFIEIEKEIKNYNKYLENNVDNNKLLNDEIVKYEQIIKNIDKNEIRLISEIKELEKIIINNQNIIEKIIEKIYMNNKIIEDTQESMLLLEEYKEEIISNQEYRIIEKKEEIDILNRSISMNEKSKNNIGPVNMSTIIEYDEEQEKLNNLINQKRDMNNSRNSLLNLIKDIENDMANKFKEALYNIDKNFTYMCKEILNDAKGSIKILDEENILDTGIELSVKYKNKSEQTLMLLSGGEKSMLAVAFIMSIFIFKPSPFTFFDEVEAALDESNTKKIIRLLNDFTTKSQFILITHNKETMKGSDRLYGVTMNKQIGESRIVAVDI